MFFIDWEDIQIIDDDRRDVLADQWRHRRKPGHRVVDDCSTRPTSLRLGFNATYTDATVTSDVPSLGGVDGDRLPYVPELTFSATADYFCPARELGGPDWRPGR